MLDIEVRSNATAVSTDWEVILVEWLERSMIVANALNRLSNAIMQADSLRLPKNESDNNMPKPLHSSPLIITHASLSPTQFLSVQFVTSRY
jgi:hypothetical protein